MVGKGRKMLENIVKGRKPLHFRRWKKSEFLTPPHKMTRSCAIDLLIRADIDGKELNKNTAESIVL
jgi:hypothetical protein